MVISYKCGKGNKVELNKIPTKKLMIMKHDDNVAVCLCDLDRSEAVDIYNDNTKIHLKIINPIPLGHKVALVNIKKEKPIIKYGEIIGKATSDIRAGDHVHVHNVTDY
jgi:altronate dehydratase